MLHSVPVLVTTTLPVFPVPENRLQRLHELDTTASISVRSSINRSSIITSNKRKYSKSSPKIMVIIRNFYKAFKIVKV